MLYLQVNLLQTSSRNIIKLNKVKLSIFVFSHFSKSKQLLYFILSVLALLSSRIQVQHKLISFISIAEAISYWYKVGK